MGNAFKFIGCIKRRLSQNWDVSDFDAINQQQQKTGKQRKVIF